METDMFSDISSSNLASYWETLTQNEAPYLTETLFPNQKQLGNSIEWFKGITNAPKPLRPSAYGAQSVPRERQGFEKKSATTNFFKESKYIDEDLRQSLLQVQNSPIQSQKDIILNRIFADEADLLRGAKLTRELIRMQMLQTGAYGLSGNGQDATDDYEMPSNHKIITSASWQDVTSKPQEDMDKAITTIGTDTGQTITRAFMNRSTMFALMANNSVKSTLLANNANTAAVQLPRSAVLAYFADQFSLDIQVYDKGYQDENGKFQKFIPDGRVIFAPDGNLGNTVFGTTPEEADLMASAAADVSIVDDGVAVTMTTHSDPVTKETKVTQSFAPTFEQIDSVYVLDAFGAAATSGSTDAPAKN